MAERNKRTPIIFTKNGRATFLATKSLTTKNLQAYKRQQKLSSYFIVNICRQSFEVERIDYPFAKNKAVIQKRSDLRHKNSTFRM